MVSDPALPARCDLCGEDAADILDHLRLFHPAEYGDGLDRWPDGAPVVVDMVPSPEEA